MHELKASALATQDCYNYYCQRVIMKPVVPPNWCLTVLVLLTDLKQTSTHLDVILKVCIIAKVCFNVPSCDRFGKV